MIGRRHLLVAGAAILGGRPSHAALPVPRSRTLAFRLMRLGMPIGTHTLTFHDQGDGLEVDIAVDVVVKVGPFPFVRYTHHSREAWQADRLVGVSSRTDRNGTKLQMAAAWTDAGLRVEGSGTRPYVAPRNASATTYWHKATLFGPLIGTQDGGLVHPAVSQHQPETIRLASGEAIAARRYVLSGDLDFELWYDSSDAWVGMRFKADDGSMVSYERL
jgi:uncharacterized protein DUF6134